MAGGQNQVLISINGDSSGLQRSVKSATSSISALSDRVKGLSGSGFKGLSAAGSAAFGALAAAGAGAFHEISGAVSDLMGDVQQSQATWATFAQNMRIFGVGDSEISKTQASLQKFAQETIFSGDDMASTYGQLFPFLHDGTEQVVKGFAGLAASAANPSQAMKTLSQQGIQAASKPMLQWQDFRLMLEQSPAGMAKVAEHMGKSMDQLIGDIQDGTVTSKDFLAAVAAVGTSDAFTAQATTFKNVSQAIDGAKEALVAFLNGQSGIDGFVDNANQAVDIAIGQFTSIAPRLVDTMSSIGGILSSHSGAMIAAMKQVGAPMVDGLIKGMDDAAPKIAQRLPDIIGRGITGATGLTGRLIPSGATLIDGLLQGMVASAPAMVTGMNTVLDQMIAAIGQHVPGMTGQLTNLLSMVPGIVADLATRFTQASGVLVPAAGTLIGALAMGIANSTPPVLDALVTLVGHIGQALIAQAPTLLNSMIQIALDIAREVPQLVSVLAPMIPQIMQELADGFSQNIGPLVSGIIAAVSSIISALPQIIAALVPMIPQIVNAMVDALIANLPAMIQGFVALFMALINALPIIISTLVPQIPKIVLALVDALIANLPAMVDGFVKLFTAIIPQIPYILSILIPAIAQLVVSLSKTLLDNMPVILGALAQGLSQLLGWFFTNLPGWWDQIWTLLKKLFGTLWDYFGQLPGALWDAVKASAAKIWPLITEGLHNVFKTIVSHIPGIGAQLASALHLADGGQVMGPGGPRSDTVPAMLSPGEFVISADAARSIGYSALDAMNATGETPVRATAGGGNTFNVTTRSEDPLQIAQKLGSLLS